VQQTIGLPREMFEFSQFSVKCLVAKQRAAKLAGYRRVAPKVTYYLPTLMPKPQFESTSPGVDIFLTNEALTRQ
jgi:hypothetical protein